MTSFIDAYHVECRKNKRMASGISPYATDLANVVGHHFHITWQDIADLRQEVQRLTERVKMLEGGA